MTNTPIPNAIDFIRRCFNKICNRAYIREPYYWLVFCTARFHMAHVWQMTLASGAHDSNRDIILFSLIVATLNEAKHELPEVYHKLKRVKEFIKGRY